MIEAVLEELKTQLDSVETITEAMVEEYIVQERERDEAFRRTEEKVRSQFPVGEKRFLCTVNNTKDFTVEIIYLNTGTLDNFLEGVVHLPDKGSWLDTDNGSHYIPRFNMKENAE
tara:strand:- start:419 stop:763 length:345 start_codon:yes stop_codon:yes gene_type:complete